LHDLMEVRRTEEKRIGKEKRKEYKLRVRPRVRQTLGHPIIITITAPVIYIPPSVCLDLSGSGVCPSRRGWGICPVRARPSWIIRGTCPLHDLMEVRIKEETGGQSDKKCDKLRVKEERSLYFTQPTKYINLYVI
jgi:hypothetical protein